MTAQLISKIANTDCSTTLITIGLPISYILIGLNLLALLLFRWKQTFHRPAFFVLYALNIILAGVVMIVGFGGIGETNSCAGNKVVHRYVGFQALVMMAVSAMTLFGEFDWGLRYANAPGNFVWPFLFFGYAWTNAFKGSYITVGVFTLLISLATFIVNVLPLRGGLTSGKKKIIHFEWIGALILMAVCEIVVFATYLGGANTTDFMDQIAKKLAQTYLPINIIDALFWIWGLLTLKYTSGDTVRDNIMGGHGEHDANDLDHQAGLGLGTIK